MQEVDKALKQTEDRISKLLESQKDTKPVDDVKELIFELINEKEKVMKEAVEHAWNAEKTCVKLAEDNLSRIIECEKAIRKFKEIKNDVDID